MKKYLWNKIKYMMSKSLWQSYDKKSLSDKNQLPLWLNRTISLWTAMEINLVIFTMYKWQSIKITMKQMQIWRFFYFNDGF